MRSATSPALPTASRRLGRAVLISFLSLMVIPLSVVPAQARLAAVGPIDPATGFPSYYEDMNGLRLIHCFDPAEGCHADVPDPASPTSFPDNFPAVSSYQSGRIPVGDWSFGFALEGTFANDNEAVVDGDQAAFVSMRVRHSAGTLTPGDVYTITHPYGDFAATVDELGEVDMRIESPIVAGNFQAAGNAWLGDAASTPAPFLTWDTFGTGVDEPPAGTVGDPLIPHAVTGSPFNTNFFRAQGPSGVFETNLFHLEGHVSLTGPVVTSPVESIVAARAGATTTPVRLRWTGTSPGGPLTYTLQRSLNGGAFTTVPLANPSAATTILQLAGGAYRFRVRGTDASASSSSFATGQAFTLRIPDQNDAAVAYTGAWTNATLAGAFGGSVRHASVLGRVATLTFTGTDVAWISTRGPDRGLARVWIDGVRVATVDLFADVVQTRRVVFVQTGLGAGSHTFQVRVPGARSGNSTGNRVDVDAFVVLT